MAVLAPEQARVALAAWRALPEGKDAALIGRVDKNQRLVAMQTELDGERVLDEL